mgnify:FL=1
MKLLKLKNILIISTIILLLSGCAGNKSPFLYIAPEFNTVLSIAVLPFENHTTDLDVGEMSRLFMTLGLKEKGYNVLSLDETDLFLQRLGITDGGQLPSVEFEKLIKLLDTETLLYGELLNAEYSTKGISIEKKVTISCKIVKNGKIIWKNQVTSKTKTYGNISAIPEQLINKTFEKAFKNYAGHPLEMHVERVINDLQKSLPGNRVEKSGWNE